MKATSIFALAFTLALLVYSAVNIFGAEPSPKRNTSFLDLESDSKIENTKQPLLAITEEIPTEEENIEAYFKELQSAMKGESHNKELNFLVFGDFGYLKGKEYDGTLELADFVFNRIKKTFLHYDFIVSVGDILYDFGVESKNDPKPAMLFEEIFKMSQLGLDWYSVLGNHDCMGNLPATYALAKKFPLWKQSESYYHRIFNIGSSHLKAGFVFLNGCELVCLKHDSPECYRGTLKNINFDILQDQVDWFEGILAEMAADESIVWKIVVVHNGIFSAGKSHGDNPELIEAVLPLLEKYEVDVVLSGHDHNVQYLRMNLKTDQEGVRADPKSSKKQPNCPHGVHDECMFGEYFHSQLTECGVTKRENQMNHLQALLTQKDKRVIDLEEVRFSRESYSNQNEYLHQFILGNGCTKVQKYCPFEHRESEGNLRYANTIMGLTDIKIQENKLEVNLLTTKNEVLYSVKILRPTN